MSEDTTILNQEVTGRPYKTLQAARAGLASKKRLGTLEEGTVVEIEGGYGIEVAVEDAPVHDSGVPDRKKPRVPIGNRNVLTAPTKTGYKRRIVNINESKEGWDRVQRFMDAGYSIVRGDVPIGDERIKQESQMGSAVIRQTGGGVKSILMEIKEDWYKEDQKAKQDRIEEHEKSMKQNVNQPGDGMYGKMTDD